MNDAYVQGFISKCAEHGIDPEVLVKQSQDRDIVDPRGSMFGDIPLSRAGRGVKDVFRAGRYATRNPWGRFWDTVKSPYTTTRGKRTYRGAGVGGKKGLMYGGGAGALLGAAIGGRDEPLNSRLVRAILLGILGAGVGGAAGAGVGGYKRLKED